MDCSDNIRVLLESLYEELAERMEDAIIKGSSTADGLSDAMDVVSARIDLLFPE